MSLNTGTCSRAVMVKQIMFYYLSRLMVTQSIIVGVFLWSACASSQPTDTSMIFDFMERVCDFSA